MLRRLVTIVLAASAPLAVPVVHAQAPKVGDYYEDNVDMGFKIKTPKDWELSPPSPSEKNLVGKWTPKFNWYVSVGNGEPLFLYYWLVEFDNRPKPEGEKEEEPEEGDVIILSSRARDVKTWMKDHEVTSGRGWRPMPDYDQPKELRGLPRDVKGTYALYEALHESDPDEKVYAYVAEFELEPNRTVAMIGEGPADPKKWRTYEKAFEKMAKSFKRVEVVEIEGVTAVGASSPREQKRQQLLMDAAKSGDWQLYETENYFIISNNDDQDFLDELMERLEAIRDIYEVDYPFEKARKIENRRATKDGDEKDEKEKDDDENRSVSASSAMEMSRTSVVRVCKNDIQYHQYGGPGGSAGYWNWAEEELVIFDDKAGGGRDDTWSVLNHEAFHQYIFYFYGNISPHSWYNEGTGDFYAGYEYKFKKFKLTEFAWRIRTIQQMIREGSYAPLKDFVTWTQQQYYGGNDLGLGGGECYAQGWSLIYFLRTGEKEARGWSKAWNKILDTYLDELAISGDLDAAVEKAFAGVDWKAFEECWASYIGSL